MKKMLLACFMLLPMLAWAGDDLDRGLKAYYNQDYAEALKWYRKAAGQGDVNAQINLGLMYEYGEGVKQDDAEAAKWFRKAAGQGFAVGQYNLGVMYQSGKGVKQDYAEALKWFRKAAGQGDADAKRMVPIAEYSLKQRNAHPHAPKLFGVPLAGAQRDEMREALKQAGVRAVREDYDYWADKYDPAGVLAGADELYVFYSLFSDVNGWGPTNYFAKAQYRFPSHVDARQISRIRDMVASKYGAPDRSAGNPGLGEASYTWLEDGVVIKVWRGWPDTTTYLEYIVPVMNKAMEEEIAEHDRKQKEKEFKKQSNAF